MTLARASLGLQSDPSKIMQMTGTPQTLLNPATFPVDPKSCQPIYPHSYLKVNTMFEVAKAAGLRTAWSDKHPVYESFNGPSGHGIDDFFAPDEINGYDHSGNNKVGTPAILGMNFQTVSTAQKLLNSEAVIGGPVLLGGYTSPGVPGDLLSSAITWVDARLKAFDDAIQANPQTRGTTAIIVTAKHGQSPRDPNQIRRIDDGPIIDAINAAWSAAHPGSGKLIVSRSMPATRRPASSACRCPTRVTPDVFGRVQEGVIYTGGSKIAEHGGDNPGDTDVPILVYAPGAIRSGSSDEDVKTTQVAPTTLRLLGLNPDALKAVQIEGTRVLPGIGEQRGHGQDSGHR